MKINMLMKMIMKMLMRMLKNSSALFLIIISILSMEGCSNESNSDMEAFIEKVKRQPAKPVPPLPQYAQFVPVAYTAATLRSPFEPAATALVEKPTGKIPDLPDMKHTREVLESFPLDALHMVGTLERAGTMYVLIKDNQGIIHRVGIGNYMGQNYGKIVKITEKFLELEELTLEGGEYKKRRIVMRLSE